MVLIMEYTQPDYKWNNKYMQVYVAACLGLEGGVGNIVNRYLEKIYKKRNYISQNLDNGSKTEYSWKDGVKQKNALYELFLSKIDQF